MFVMPVKMIFRQSAIRWRNGCTAGIGVLRIRQFCGLPGGYEMRWQTAAKEGETADRRRQRGRRLQSLWSVSMRRRFVVYVPIVGLMRPHRKRQICICWRVKSLWRSWSGKNGVGFRGDFLVKKWTFY